jgi:hypothetical protein
MYAIDQHNREQEKARRRRQAERVTEAQLAKAPFMVLSGRYLPIQEYEIEVTYPLRGPWTHGSIAEASKVGS